MLLPSEATSYSYTELPYTVNTIPTSAINDCEITGIVENNEVAEINNNYIKCYKSGETNINIQVKYKNGKIFNIEVPLKVIDNVNYEVSSTRTIEPTGISIVNKIEQLKVGDEFVLLALLYPHHPFMDNLIEFTSSDDSICSVKFGVLKANKVGTCTITATGIGTNISESFNIEIIANEEESLLDSDIYNVCLPCPTTNGQLYNDGTNEEQTTYAIQDLLSYASENNYKKIVFPKGTYSVTADIYGSDVVEPTLFYVPSNLIIDFSGSIIQMQPNSHTLSPNGTAGTGGGYSTFTFSNNCENSKIINADIRGCRELIDYPINTTGEQCKNVIFYDAINCSLENCSIGNSCGFNIAMVRNNYNGWDGKIFIMPSNIESGGIADDGSKDDVNTSWNWRTINMLSLDKLGDRLNFDIGNYQGWGGYQIPARLYDIAFYDENKNFIEIMRNCRVYCRYNRPVNSKYFHIVFHQEEQPTDGVADYGYLYTLHSTLEPYRCSIKNCIIHDNYSIGIAIVGGKNNTFEGNTFINNNGRDPNCHFDYEDGRESMIGDIWKYNSFDSQSGHLCIMAGNAMTFRNNIFNCSAQFTGRCEGWRVYNNKFNSSTISQATQSDSVFGFNLLNNATLGEPSYYHGEDAQYKIHYFNNNVL